ncbi:MAG: prepilin peptidase [bacterium]|nr:prepilin peptidase [bacterium]
MWWWFASGAIAGSVANALIYRVPRRISWWQGRSHCPHCKHDLTGLDLVPLLSYILLAGKCRYCHQPISPRYFLVELGLAAGFAYFHSPLLAAILWVTVIIAAMDWETMLVSDWLVAVWAILVIVWQYPLNFSQMALGIAVGVGVIGGIWAVTRGRAMGLGDVEIVAVAGLWLGWPKILPALWVAFVAGAIIAVGQLLFKKKKLQSQIAFGPFLILGVWVAHIVNWIHVLPF